MTTLLLYRFGYIIVIISYNRPLNKIIPCSYVSDCRYAPVMSIMATHIYPWAYMVQVIIIPLIETVGEAASSFW